MKAVWPYARRRVQNPERGDQTMGNLPLEGRLAQMGRDLRQELSEGRELSGSFFCRMGKLFVEELLDAEVTDALGRGKGERRGPAGESGHGGGGGGLGSPHGAEG